MGQFLRHYESDHAIDRIQNLIDLDSLGVNGGEVLQFKRISLFLFEVDVPKETRFFI